MKATHEIGVVAARIERLLTGAEKMRIALMCAEAEPLDCHRTILVATALAEQGAQIRHVLSDGRVEDHQASSGA